MLLRTIFLILFIYTLSFAGFEKVRIGKIDSFYNDKITKQELENIIQEIEYTFENQLGTNVFDYSFEGKPIDLLYSSPSKLERNINYKASKQEQIEKEINSLRQKLPSSKKRIDSLKKRFKEKNNENNRKIREFNSYIKKVNQRKTISTQEYKELKEHVRKKKNQFHKEKKELEKIQRELNFLVKKYNSKINRYNNQISKFNTLSQEIESMSKTLKRIRGRTFGVQEITYKTYIKNGQKIREKNVSRSMSKIEIYGFDNKAQLKAILAHEIGHLIGMTHINTKGALMNPVLQENQESQLYLTLEDMENFYENY